MALVQKPLDEALARQAKLRETRNGVDSLKLTGGDSYRFYTGLIGSYLDVVAAVATSSHKHEIIRIATAYYSFIRAKEETGRERATLNGVLVADRFDTVQFQRTRVILASQKIYLESFDKYASAAERTAFEEKAKSPSFQKVEELRSAVLGKGMEGGFGIAHQMATAAEEQTAVTAEISSNIHQINEVVFGTSRGAHETASAAGHLSRLARDQQEMVSRFKLA